MAAVLRDPAAGGLLGAGILVALSALACGGAATQDSGDDGSSGGASDGGTGDGGTGDGGTGDGGTGDGGTGNGGSAGQLSECSTFADQTGGQVTIIIENQRSTSVFLGPFQSTCGPQPLFELRQGDESIEHFDYYCTFSCQDVIESGIPGCPAICLYPETVELGPGESHTIEWNALIHELRSLPDACRNDEYQSGGDLECFQRVRVPEGTYTFVARAGKTLDCETLGLPDQCETCEVSDRGGCVYQGPIASGGQVLAETVVELGPEHGIDGGADEAPLPIELVFTD